MIQRPSAGAVSLAREALRAGPVAQVVVDGHGTVVLASDRAVAELGADACRPGEPLADEGLRLLARRCAASAMPRDLARPPHEVSITPLQDGRGASLTFVDVSERAVLDDTQALLRATVAELASLAEQLSVGNAQLESVSEELGAANLELETLNDELRRRSVELAELEGTLHWVLRAGGVAALVADHAGRVRVWSAGAERLWSLPAARAEGRAVHELDLGVAARQLGDAVERALRGAVREGEELAADDGRGHVVACRLHAHDPPAEVPGGVVVFMRRARGDWAPGVSGHASSMAPGGHHSFELRVPAVPQSVGELRHALSERLETLPVPTELVEDIGLAVSEAATNAVLHAYLGDSQPGPLLLSARLMDDRVHVVVRDHGRGMTPRPDSPGLGLGLPLMTRLADAVQISTHPEGGTEVRMTFTVDREEARPRFAH